MITIQAPVWVWKGESAGRWHFVTVPEEQSTEIRAHAFGSPRGFRSVRVEAAIGAVRWRTSIFPLKDGGYILPIKAEVRRKADIGEGDEITVAIEPL